MSYKVDLSDLSAGSVSAELVRRFAHAIEAGTLAGGERLPTTRELAREAGINPMTAARVYRRLAELGYVSATVGRGTFVREVPPFAAEELDEDWQSLALPPAPGVARERLVAETMRLAGRDDVISLGAGMLDTSLLPLEGLRAAASAVLADAPNAFNYNDVEGVPELREELGALGIRRAFASGADEILVTAGARQAVDLVARTLLQEGDVACVDSPTFIGMLGSLEATGARLFGIPTDGDGLDVAALERVLQRHPVKLVVVQPACHNPTGRVLSEERRRRLVELARERSFFVLEDGVYADLLFDGPPPSALRSAAPAHFIYASSFSKTLGGGLRVGWIAARGPVFNRLVALKTTSDLNTSAFDQHVLARFLRSDAYPRHLERAGVLYGRRAAVLLDAIERHLPGEVDVTPPLGGHHLWLTFRRRIDEQALYLEALRRGVSVWPGSALLVEPATRPSVRLCFSRANEEELDEGVKRLGAAYRAVLRDARHALSAAN